MLKQKGDYATSPLINKFNSFYKDELQFIYFQDLIHHIPRKIQVRTKHYLFLVTLIPV